MNIKPKDPTTPILVAARRRKVSKAVASSLIALGLLMLFVGLGCLVKGVLLSAQEMNRLSQENEALWHRIEMLEAEDELHTQSIEYLEDDVEELEGRWVEADSFTVSDETGECESMGFKVGDRVYIPDGPCKKPESAEFRPFKIDNDHEFNAMADALLAHYEKELEE